MARKPLSPLGAVMRGMVAGVVGTAVMTGWQELAAKLQESGEESSGSDDSPQDPWEEASAPAKVAKRIGEGVFKKEVSADLIPLLTNVMHWGYGAGWGSLYGLLAGTRGKGTLRQGLAFGTGVWAMSYVQLVPMGLYDPPWDTPPKDLALDLSYHLVYGAGVGSAYAAVSR